MQIFKSLAACLGEIVSTMLRAIISSAISRPVHWLIGRPDFSGDSHASASSWQRWSAVIRAGPPGRGRSSIRSSTLSSSSGIGSRVSHRSRHCLTVSRLTPTSRPIAELSFPSAVSRIILARLAICCRVLCPMTSIRNLRWASFVNATGVGFGPGIFHSLSWFFGISGVDGDNHRLKPVSATGNLLKQVWHSRRRIYSMPSTP